MKGLANSVGAAAIFALGLHPGASGQSLRQGTTGSGRTARVAETGSRMEITGANDLRGLQSADHRADGETDDALDVNGTVSDSLYSEGCTLNGSQFHYGYTLSVLREEVCYKRATYGIGVP